MIVDDSPMMRRLLIRTISLEGEFRFLEVASASEAIKRLGRLLPELIMLDVNLGEENGLDLLASLKKMEVTKDIPIVVCSANTDATVLETAKRHGATAFIPKPISAKQLRSVVRKIFDPEGSEEEE